MPLTITAFVIAYVVGGIPMGIIIGKTFYNKDIRKHGSGNIGMANAFRTLGPVGGIVVLLADITKGVLAVAIADSVIPASSGIPFVSHEAAAVIAGGLAIFGASYSVFLKLSGGKSVGAATGVVLSLYPWSIPILVGVWLAIVALTRYISLGGIVVAICLPLFVYFRYSQDPVVLATIGSMSALVIYRHHSNIIRIIQGNERRFSLRREEEEA